MRAPLATGSLVVAGVLLAAYHLYLSRAAPSPALHLVRSQWRRNIVRAQVLLYDTSQRDARTVVVGSSLSTRLPPHGLPGPTTNLAFGGLSPLHGVELLRRSGLVPARVLLETNEVLSGFDREFLESVLGEPAWRLRRWFPMLREQNRPLVVFARQLQFPYYWFRDKLAPGAGSDRPAGAGDVPVPAGLRDALRERAITEFERAYRTAPAPEAMANALASLEGAVLELRARGTSVLLFEAPIHRRLRQTARVVAVRQGVDGLARKLRVPHLVPPLTTDYRTSDAQHLDEEGARDFARWLAASLPDEARISP